MTDRRRRSYHSYDEKRISQLTAKAIDESQREIERAMAARFGSVEACTCPVRGLTSPCDFCGGK